MIRFSEPVPGQGVLEWSMDMASQAVLEEFDDVLEQFHSGTMSEKSYVARLQELAVAHPDFIDTYAHLGNYWFNKGKPRKALDQAMLGLVRANSRIPEGFTGQLEWGHLENRPYLRLLHLAILAQMRLRKYRDAAKLIEIMLERNPDDHIGVRFLLGSILLRDGNIQRAREVFIAEASAYPPYHYELAMSHLVEQEWADAASALRRGFAANHYIGEALAGGAVLAPLPLWHASGDEMPETACDYIEDWGALWFGNEGALAFVRWLYNHSAVLKERAGIMACREGLTWESDPAVRQAIIRRQVELIEAIDDKLSREIVAARTTLRGQTCLPWGAAGLTAFASIVLGSTGAA